jgi:simple sugar transport system ATP-binding protein
MDGERVVFANPRDARARGIATVHQDVGTVPLMSVARNFFLGAEPTKGWGPFRSLDLETAERIALEQIRSFGITRVKNGEQLVGTLSGGERQVLAIARAMYFGARVLILDEPTSALGVREAAKVLTLVKTAKKRGIGTVFITHNARHALLVGDHFVVLNHGAVLASFQRGEKTREEVLNLMAGGETAKEIEADLALVEEDSERAV